MKLIKFKTEIFTFVCLFKCLPKDLILLRYQGSNKALLEITFLSSKTFTLIMILQLLYLLKMLPVMIV